MGYAYFVAEIMWLLLLGMGPGITNHKMEMELRFGQKMKGKERQLVFGLANEINTPKTLFKRFPIIS